MIEFLKTYEKQMVVTVNKSGTDRFLYRERCRALKGEQIYESVPWRKFERCNIVAGKCGKEVIAPFGYTGTCDSKLFLKRVQEALVLNLNKNQIVIMDNAAIHKSPEIRKVIEKAGCKPAYLPSYLPDLNPIEHFWHYLKLKIGSSKQKFDSLFDSMQYALAN